jgi:hypothetical protein
MAVQWHSDGIGTRLGETVVVCHARNGFYQPPAEKVVALSRVAMSGSDSETRTQDVI